MLQFRPERLDVADYANQPIDICGWSFLADMSGALYWPARNALIVADLHLEKGSSYAPKGVMLPPYDTRDTLQRLAEAIDRYKPETVIALGDSLHDVDAASRIAAEDLQTLRIIQDDVDWIWITGNHDPEIADKLGGHVIDGVDVDGLRLRHEPTARWCTHEIAGHLHPAAKVAMHGYRIRRPCFISNGLRLVMPAFGTFTGGLNVLDDAFVPLFANDGFAVWILGQEGLYPVATRLLKED